MNRGIPKTTLNENLSKLPIKRAQSLANDGQTELTNSKASQYVRDLSSSCQINVQLKYTHQKK
jgi:hypothetical protein